MKLLKQASRRLLVSLLDFEAKLVLRRYRPRIIGITGNVGKTSAKEAIYTVLNERLKVRRSEKSFNSEIGLPLSILGRPNAWGRPMSWLRNLGAGLALALFRHDYPEWLVLEIGVDRPGDIKRLSGWLKLDAAVLTSLPDLPVHLEFFASPEALAAEKLLLLHLVKPGGLVVLNGDDARIREARDNFANEFKNKALKVITYGFGPSNDLRLNNEHLYYEGGKPMGLTFKLDEGGHTVPFRLPEQVGRPQLYAAAAALAVGLGLDFNLIEMAEALLNYLPPAGRLRLLKGVKGSMILDDTYNASPAAMAEALETLRAIDVAGRRIAVLGDMMELGAKTIEAHRAVGEQTAAVANVIVTIGIRAKFISEAARAKGFAPERLYHFDEAPAAGVAVERLLGAGDLILIKGSQSMRLEQVVEEIMAEPERKADLLVRQDAEWQER
ncbi:MAG: UDP-N-acetylmuramoyl-tripeptide--D-alanyl-D-alanine ligase [Patescibacteria group bacterium]